MGLRWNLKPTLAFVGSGASQEELWCRPRLVATCVGLGGAWKKLCQKQKLAVTCAGLETFQWMQ